MSYHRRHLPHWIPEDTAIFVTFRLTGNLPWLQDERIAEIVANAVLYGAQQRYALYAWVVMPDHVHLIIQPRQELSAVLRWLKGRTARVANGILGRTGAFWQEESFDHWIRNPEEFDDFVRYIENNPVKAGLVDSPEQWKWSSRTDDRLSSSVNPVNC